MGKKGSWFSAIKRVFLPSSKDKVASNESSDKKTSSKEKKKKGSSFIPLFREPSSIEKILDEAEREHRLTFRPPTPPPDQPRTPTFVPPPPSRISSSPRVPSLRVTSPRPAASPRVASPPPPPPPRAASPKAAPSSSSTRATPQRQNFYRPEPTARNQNASATKIQAAFRGYVARRSFRALKGLVRLQGVIRGQNVKRQTMNAMKSMQLMVRVQSQIQSRRIQMLESQARQHKNDKEVESNLGKWSQVSEGQNDDWDDSVLTKEEIEARTQRKIDAAIKRERAMAYAYSHQLWKATPKSTQLSLTDMRSNGFPWWWNWLERPIPASSSSNNHETQPPPPPPTTKTATKTFQRTPTRPASASETKPPSPQLFPSSDHHHKQFGHDALDTPTPRSTRSTAAAFLSRQARTPHRTPQQGNTSLSKYSRARGGGNDESSPFNNLPMKDDDSLTSCPPFSVPNYMNPTMSAKAKARANSNPRERMMSNPGTPGSEKRRSSFPMGSFKWNAGSLFTSSSSNNANKNNASNSNSPRMMIPKHHHQGGGADSVANLSVDSTVSMPAAVGRRPFNRFV
ncbi:Protein IQ-DOMAIN 13 [Linum perenne]